MDSSNPNYTPAFLNQLTQSMAILQPTPVHNIKLVWPNIENISLHIKRDDLLHPIISGNKWRKLKYSLAYAQQHKVRHIISFGGGFSNHLHALAYCCHRLKIEFSAIVRGDYSANPSPMLQDLTAWQANIHYVNKLTYQQRAEPNYLEQLQQQFPHAMIIPEGGSNDSALKGVAEIISELVSSYDYIIAPVASGGTLAGLIAATHNTATQVLGIGVLKGQGYLEELVQCLLPKTYAHWSICHEYHFGGYAKRTDELVDFCANFYQQSNIPIEPVYSGKLLYALKDLLEQSYFPKGSKILVLHTGGLQGSRLNP
ncbi:pyridoxal-phosphate dependent enzyme [Paraglaciecola sp. 25GB23A]|uniref:1-aminocyclopropane-1-carboxylate deaminase/D-cysteine desulfhydrase n=1 Tax=Paraglaciecola sp. 25GB23A TaxID=3156068 RepID=UPI0032AFB76E